MAAIELGGGKIAEAKREGGEGSSLIGGAVVITGGAKREGGEGSSLIGEAVMITGGAKREDRGQKREGGARSALGGAPYRRGRVGA
jgi:hypothetical protein